MRDFDNPMSIAYVNEACEFACQAVQALNLCTVHVELKDSGRRFDAMVTKVPQLDDPEYKISLKHLNMITSRADGATETFDLYEIKQLTVY